MKQTFWQNICQVMEFVDNGGRKPLFPTFVPTGIQNKLNNTRNAEKSGKLFTESAFDQIEW